MGLPEGFEEKSKEDWMALAKSGDAAERKQVSNCLRALGYDPPMFLTWDAKDRVAKVMEHQDGSGGKKASGGKTSGKTSGKAANKNKTANKSKTSSGGGGGGGGGGGNVDLGPLEEKVEALEAKVGELGDANDVAMEYIRETHTMMRVFFQSNEDAKNNLEELGNYFHGKLIGLEEEENAEEG